jgi:hypothetical protein
MSDDKVAVSQPAVLHTKEATWAVRLVPGMDRSVFVSTSTGCASMNEFLTPAQARERAKALNDAADAVEDRPAMDMSGVLEGSRLGQAGEGS